MTGSLTGHVHIGGYVEYKGQRGVTDRHEGSGGNDPESQNCKNSETDGSHFPLTCTALKIYITDKRLYSFARTTCDSLSERPHVNGKRSAVILKE